MNYTPHSKTENKGRWLQDGLASIAAAYAGKGVLKMEKADPPLRVIGGVKGFRGATVIPLPNPFLDFVGTWTERGGRMLCLEAKSTHDHSLPLFRDGGITLTQWENLGLWRKAGAAVAVIWGHTPTAQVRFLSFEMMEARQRAGQKSIRWEHAEFIGAGYGFVTADFAQNLRDWHPEAKMI